MHIIEETVALGVPFCHFRNSWRNQYNLTFTKTNKVNGYEIHIIPLVILHDSGKIMFDRDMRLFICQKILDFMQNNSCQLYFNINCIGKSNNILLQKFIRWIKFFNAGIPIRANLTQDISAQIRFFEFFIG